MLNLRNQHEELICTVLAILLVTTGISDTWSSRCWHAIKFHGRMVIGLLFDNIVHTQRLHISREF